MSRSFWKPNRIAAVLVMTVVLLASYTPTAHRLESQLPYWTSRFIPEADPAQSVVVAAIDEPSLDAYGSWPWTRDSLAGVIERLSQFGPKAIGFMIPLTEPETAVGLETIREELDALDNVLRKKATTWLSQLDTDAKLAKAMRDAGNVVLAAPYFTLQTEGSLPYNLRTLAIETDNPQSLWTHTMWRLLLSAPTETGVKVTSPLPVFLGSTSRTGLISTYTPGQRVHGFPLTVNVGDQFLPAFELSLFTSIKSIDTMKVRVNAATELLSARNRTIGSKGFYYYPAPSAPPLVHSLKDIMSSDSLAQGLRDKVVLIGLAAPGLAPEIKGPASRSYTPVSWSAHLLGSMLDNNAFSMPDWFYGIQRALLVLIGLYFIFLPASWLGTRGMVFSALLSILLLNTGVVTLIAQHLWLPVVTPALFMITLQLILYLAWRRHKILATANQALIDARIELGSNLQSQGQLDQAMEKFVECLPDQEAIEPLYELGLEYERRRQVGKAQSIYKKLDESVKGYRDSAQRNKQLAALSDRFPSTNPPSVGKTLVIDTPMMELPVLGRYRLERELGRGAMGTVYLAMDPTISREVAIKTLTLMDEYATQEREAITERFFQEAEAVGRLDHPNIVSIHDAGREHDLAYLAMDYVPGQSLDTWTCKSDLLPVWEVLEIAAQVADALAYAHKRKVVHRDIKPGNIIYDRESGVVKITDFGVARILDSSRTRTGTVLGSPSYMSPEQVAGKKTDGRSDLFSLGTTLYQLLTGNLPFNGDSVATLMYQIANQKPPAVRKARRGLPVCIGRLMAKALQKEPARRFATGEAMATALLNCRAQFKGGRRKTA